MEDPNHQLRKTRQLTTRGAFRNHAFHALDESRLIGRHGDAAELNAACEENIPWSRDHADRPHREGVFAPSKPAKQLLFPKFK
jgi:hypothetical protein